MALVVLFRKPPEHGSIVHIRFRAAVPVEEKEIAVTVNGDFLRSLAVLQHAPQRFAPIPLLPDRKISDKMERKGELNNGN